MILLYNIIVNGIVTRENVTIMATMHDNFKTDCHALSVLFCIVVYSSCHTLSTILQGIGLQMPQLQIRVTDCPEHISDSDRVQVSSSSNLGK
jgi:hypothetical protein